MHTVLRICPLCFVLLGCAVRPDVAGVLRECPATVGDVGPLAVADDLRSGDRLVYEWASSFGVQPVTAVVTLVVGTIDAVAADERLDPAAERLDGLPEVVAAIGDVLGFDVGVGGPRTLDVPVGRVTFDCAIAVPGREPTHVAMDLPIACRGAGILSAAPLFADGVPGRSIRLGWQQAADLLLAQAAAWQLAESPEIAARLPGVAEAERELADLPSLWRIVTRGLFLQSLRVEFPFWRGAPLGDGRVRVPFTAAWGAHALVHGVVDLAPPRGALCLTSGIVGLCCWRPGAPERNVTLRLVAVEAAAGAP